MTALFAVLVFSKTADGLFYEAFFEDAEAIATQLDLILTSKRIDDPTVERVPLAGFPVHPLDRFIQPLSEVSPVVNDIQFNLPCLLIGDFAIDRSVWQSYRQVVPLPGIPELELQAPMRFDNLNFTFGSSTCPSAGIHPVTSPNP